MITQTELGRLWTEIVSQSGKTVGRRADPEHPLDFFITYDERNNMQLVLLADFQPSLPSSSKQILVRGNSRNDGKYAICFSLEDFRLSEQFISLCWDLMDCTRNSTTPKSGVLAAIKRFAMWQKLFAESKEKTLSDIEIKGLIGELLVLRRICLEKYSASIAVSGWVGPLGADRDFEYDKEWYESKLVSLSMDRVTISSVDQLDTERPGFLILSRVEKNSSEATGAISVNKLIDEVSNTISVDSNAIAIFKNRLALAGYDSSDERCEQSYVVHRIDKYRIEDDSFPRIVRSKISPAISNGEYQLSIPALQEWLCETI